jgi:hypothetical protein
MKNIMQLKCSSIKYLLVIVWAALSLGVTSCDSDDEGASSQVVLESFGPTGVKHGESIVFIGRNLDKVTSIEFVGLTVDKGSFTSQSSEKIEMIVADEIEEGKITLKTPDGDVPSKSILSFDVTVTIATVPAEVRPGGTMTITGEYVNWITEVWFPQEVVADEIVSKSVNEIVFTVPMEAQTGPVTFVYGGTEGDAIDWEDEVIVTLPKITSFAPMTVERGDEITITGEDLDLVEGILFKGSDNAITTFVDRTTTQIKVIVPDYTNKGKISLVAFSGVKVESTDVLVIPLPPLAPLGFVIYDDALQNGWSKWGGWGSGSSDINNTDNVRMGDKGIKIVFGGGWGGSFQTGGSAATAGYTKFVLSIFGNPGTGGKVVNLIVKGGTTEEKQITIVEGEWTEYEFPLSTTFGNPVTLTEMFFQDRDWSGTIYVDHIGLR